jgi:hypothetical protein
MMSFIICCFHFYLSVSLCHDPFSSVLQPYLIFCPCCLLMMLQHEDSSSRGNLARVKCSGGWDKSVVQCPSTWMGLTRTL